MHMHYKTDLDNNTCSPGRAGGKPCWRGGRLGTYFAALHQINRSTKHSNPAAVWTTVPMCVPAVHF